MAVEGISAVLDLPQRLKVAQKYVTQPLGVHTGDLPLFGLFILEPTRSAKKSVVL